MPHRNSDQNRSVMDQDAQLTELESQVRAIKCRVGDLRSEIDKVDDENLTPLARELHALLCLDWNCEGWPDGHVAAKWRVYAQMVFDLRPRNMDVMTLLRIIATVRQSPFLADMIRSQNAFIDGVLQTGHEGQDGSDRELARRGESLD